MADIGVLGRVLTVDAGVFIKLEVVFALLRGVLVLGGTGEVNTEWIFDRE